MTSSSESKKRDESTSSALVAEERELLRRHPMGKSAIFLPTEKFSLEQRVFGLRRVVELYESGFRDRHLARLRALRQRFAGTERAFVVGNGPSLNQTDLALLRNEVTFGVNGIFLKFQETQFRPTLYVVEDHLVAEDRAEAINALKGPIKLFPINLAYCLQEGEDTIFFDHRPRRRFPTDFDFSTNAAHSTFAGCTVTFTCLQLAYYLGFRQIYLIGVDCSYVLPADIEKNKSYAVATLDMKSDDPNHFDPNYFGKGFRWHDPQVDKMQEAYVEAQRVTALTTVPIYNATLGGHLRAFARRDYPSLFQQEHAYPRVLFLDISEVGSISATGQLKSQWLVGWPQDRWMQVYAVNRFRLGIRIGDERLPRTFGASDFEAVLKTCAQFRPDVVYCRPVPENRTLLDFTRRICDRLGVPVVTHVMDDWPARVKHGEVTGGESAVATLRDMLARSHARLAIGERMAAAFESRYGVPFRPLANAVDPADWAFVDTDSDLQRLNAASAPFVVRYVGALADNMTFQSVVDVANAVSRLHGRLPISMEIYTMKLWQSAAKAATGSLPGITVRLANCSPEEYRRTLAGAGCLLLAYNFDERSIDYTRYSIANKLPELLASARPVLAYGPQDVASVEYVASLGCGEIVQERDRTVLEAALERLCQDRERCAAMGRAGRALAFERHGASRVRGEFLATLTDAARSYGWVPGSPIKPAGDPGIIGAGLRPSVIPAAVLELVTDGSEDQAKSVWIDPGDPRVKLLREALQRRGRETAMQPSTPSEVQAPHVSRLIEISQAGTSSDARSASPRVELNVFALDRGDQEMDPRHIARFVGGLLAAGYDVWCLEERVHGTWWGATRRRSRLVHAPCAVAATASSVLVFAFADPVHPYDLQRVFGAVSMPGLLQGLRRKAARAAFAMKRAAARLKPSPAQ